jgi:hypothetical protein
VVGAAGLIRTRVGALLVVGVVAADLFFSFGGFYEWREVGPTAMGYSREIATQATPWGGVAAAPGGIGRYLYVGSEVQPIGLDFVEVTDAKRLRSVNANNVLMARDYADALGMTDAGLVLFTDDLWRQSSHVLDLLRVTTVVLKPELARGGPGPSALLVNGRPAGGLVRYEYQPKLPEAFVVGAAQRTTLSSAIRGIHGASAFDPASVALLDRPCAACPTGPPGAAGTAGGVAWGLNRAGVTVDATRPAMLVLSQAWSPGWEARIDGHAVPVVRADGLVQGVPVPAGSHRVELAYRAPGLRTGFLIAIGTLGAILLVAVACAFRTTLRKRVVSKPGPPDTVWASST